MRKISLLLPLLTSPFFMTAQLSVKNLLCENRSNPVGIDVTQPRLSWQLVSDKRSTVQTAYEIKVSTDQDVAAEKKQVWSSGKVASGQSVHVPYAGAELEAGKKYYWQVRVWNNYENTSTWSEPAFWQMGLLQPQNWQAKWIE